MEVGGLLVLVTAVTVGLCVSYVGSDELTGPNVCSSVEIHTEKTTVVEYEVDQIKRPYFCLKNFRFRCFKHIERVRPKNSEKISEKYSIVKECCEGYERTPNGTRCRPVCEEPCAWGTCVSPNFCKCDKYYEGPHCDIRTGCQHGTYGNGCTQNCNCQNNAACDPTNGSCYCQPGYTGKYCETPCRPGFYGYNCENECNCPNDANCDAVNGICTCRAGHTGQNCESTCPPGFYGYNCQNECKCQNNGVCDPINGICTCPSGIEGKHCEFTCPQGFYGFKCKNKCTCKNGTNCDPVNGNCFCQPGYLGKNCESRCPTGFYGLKCKYECKCHNGAACNPENGICTCQPGFAGRYCESTCQPGYYGRNCHNTCKCQNGAECDPVNGVCYCEPGYVGKYCASPCPSGFYGCQCQHKCSCQHGATCNPVNGMCKCPKDMSKTNCMIMNRFRTYGENLDKMCDCNWHKADSCDPLTGECKCKHKLKGVCYCEPGWTGYDCKTICPPGTFGIDCSSTCLCQNGAICRPTDGVCLCKPGFYGPTCAKVCPKNYYGDMCLHKCACDTATEKCDPIKGCVCDTNSASGICNAALRYGSENEPMTWLFDISIILSFIIMSTICAAVLMCYFYYHRNVPKCNRPHFELRKFTNPETNHNIGLISINGMCDRRMKNVMFNLGKPISYTNEMFYVEYGSTRGQKVNAHGYETDENLYLEIGERAPGRQEDLYDHLDFLRPTGSWKPHYQSTIPLHEQSNNSSSNSSSHVQTNQ